MPRWSWQDWIRPIHWGLFSYNEHERGKITTIWLNVISLLHWLAETNQQQGLHNFFQTQTSKYTEIPLSSIPMWNSDVKRILLVWEMIQFCHHISSTESLSGWCSLCIRTVLIYEPWGSMLNSAACRKLWPRGPGSLWARIFSRSISGKGSGWNLWVTRLWISICSPPYLQLLTLKILCGLHGTSNLIFWTWICWMHKQYLQKYPGFFFFWLLFDWLIVLTSKIFRVKYLLFIFSILLHHRVETNPKYQYSGTS